MVYTLWESCLWQVRPKQARRVNGIHSADLLWDLRNRERRGTIPRLYDSRETQNRKEDARYAEHSIFRG